MHFTSAHDCNESGYHGAALIDAPDSGNGQKQTYTLFVDNRDRDASRYSNPFDFAVTMDSIGVPALKGVESIKLKMCTVPKCTSEDYVLLDLGYNDNDVLSTDNQCPYPSMFLYYDSSFMPSGGVKVISDCKAISFNPTITLSSLKIKIKKHGGHVLTTGDTSNASNCSFLFSITTQNFRI